MSAPLELQHVGAARVWPSHSSSRPEPQTRMHYLTEECVVLDDPEKKRWWLSFRHGYCLRWYGDQIKCFASSKFQLAVMNLGKSWAIDGRVSPARGLLWQSVKQHHYVEVPLKTTGGTLNFKFWRIAHFVLDALHDLSCRTCSKAAMGNATLLHDDLQLHACLVAIRREVWDLGPVRVHEGTRGATAPAREYTGETKCVSDGGFFCFHAHAREEEGC